jgi:hypothetical protein
MHTPRDVHLAMLKRILRYVKGTTSLGVQLRAVTSPTIFAYSDADWAGCPDTRRSTSGFCVFLGSSLILWSSKHQTTVSRLSAKAEYRAIANAVSECSWLRQLLSELLYKVPSATVAFCDNISSVYMSRNPVHHRRTKHIELDIHFVREKVAVGELRVDQWGKMLGWGVSADQHLQRLEQARVSRVANVRHSRRHLVHSPRQRPPQSALGITHTHAQSSRRPHVRLVRSSSPVCSACVVMAKGHCTL